MKREIMLKKIKTSVFLIILSEILYWILNYLSSNNNSNFGDFTSGVLLGISVGIKLIGIILLLVCIVKYKDE
jgi:hypothetical protein